MKKNVSIIISISSDIGFELGKKWLESGDVVFGTYRTYNNKLEVLKNMGCKLVKCDLKNDIEIDKFVSLFSE